MEREDMINRLNRDDIKGIGAIATTKEGKEYYFYEDMSDSKGIDRAARHGQIKIDAGYWLKVEYIHKSNNHVYFVDWNEQKNNFCMNDFYVRYCKNFNYDFYYYYDSFRAVIHENTYKFDYLAAIDGIIEVIKIAV